MDEIPAGLIEVPKKKFWTSNLMIVIYVILIVFIAYFIYGYYSRLSNSVESAYNRGLNDGVIALAKQINEKGLIPVIFNDTIQNVPIQQICESMK